MRKKTLMMASFLLIGLALTGCLKQSQPVQKTTQEPVTQVVEQETVMNNRVDGNYTIETEKSVLKWIGKKVLVDSTHYGVVKIKEGNLTIANGDLTTGSFIIDMTTIESQDLEGDGKKKMEDHLNDADFFNTAEFKEAKLTIKTASKSSSNANVYNVVADLEIKKIIKEIAFQAELSDQDGMLKAMAKFNIDRTMWDIKYGSGKFFDDLGDKVIDDKIWFEVDLVAKQ